MSKSIRDNRYLQKLSHALFGVSPQRDAFLDCFGKAHLGEKAAVWISERPAELPSAVMERAPFQPHWIDRPGDNTWGRHALHDQGAYYLMDLSSVFCASALGRVELHGHSPSILDVCASPGGKSIYAWRMLHPQLLVSNETIRSRTKALISNLARCHIDRALVTSSDSSYFQSSFPNSFDIVLVDAPCSGQSLLLRGIKNDGAFHPLSVNRNAQRQRKIIAQSSSAVRPGGYLLYMTCTFAPEENEEVAAWFVKKFPEFTSIPLCDAAHYDLAFERSPGARLFPFSGFGAGGFAALFRKEGELTSEDPAWQRIPELRPLWQSLHEQP